MAQSGHSDCRNECPLSGLKRTSQIAAAMSAYDPFQTSDAVPAVPRGYRGTGGIEGRRPPVTRSARVAAPHLIKGDGRNPRPNSPMIVRARGRAHARKGWMPALRPGYWFDAGNRHPRC
jgi:hypothetical protein